MYRHVYTMYIHICKFPFMYMTRTGIYINVQTCMYICLFVYTWYIHVHTMYVHVWHFLTCTYMLNTCLYRFSKSCPGGQDSRWVLLARLTTALGLWGPDWGCQPVGADGLPGPPGSALARFTVLGLELDDHMMPARPGVRHGPWLPGTVTVRSDGGLHLESWPPGQDLEKR